MYLRWKENTSPNLLINQELTSIDNGNNVLVFIEGGPRFDPSCVPYFDVASES